MIIYRDGQHEIHQLQRMIQKLQLLLDDLVAIGEGDLPDQNRLEEAPLIDNWHLSTREIVCLRGEISGHPRLGYAPHGITSDLWLLAPQRGFARTLSRYYRLGAITQGGSTVRYQSRSMAGHPLVPRSSASNHDDVQAKHSALRQIPCTSS